MRPIKNMKSYGKSKNTGCPWIPVNVQGCRWLSRDIHGHLCWYCIRRTSVRVFFGRRCRGVGGEVAGYFTKSLLPWLINCFFSFSWFFSFVHFTGDGQHVAACGRQKVIGLSTHTHTRGNRIWKRAGQILRWPNSQKSGSWLWNLKVFEDSPLNTQAKSNTTRKLSRSSAQI